LIGGWQTTGITTLQSGGPLTVTAGSDVSGTALNNDRGVLVKASPYGSNSCGTTTFCASWLDKTAFAQPAPGTFGNRGKGNYQGPGSFTWDMGLEKNIPLHDRFSLQFRAEFFNVFNRVNYGNPNTSASAAAFGTITSAGDPRIGQLAMKLKF
jgi:hypothetical protein